MHRIPRLSVYARHLIVERMESGRSASVVSEELGVSRATVYKWWGRFQAEGEAGLLDRPCRPRSCPTRLSPEVEAEIVALRRTEKLGPHRLSERLGHPASTCYQVLRRHSVHRLDWMDRPTGRVIRRYERESPGELVHVDVKKLGRIPPGGGHKVHGRAARPDRKRRQGYDFIHSMVDDHSRLAYSEILSDEQGPTCAAFLTRAVRWFAEQGVAIERVMTDNAMNYRHSRDFKGALTTLGAKHLLTAPYRPQTNGKVERFNRTLLEEWAYVRPYRDNQERADLLTAWLHRYNFIRTHTALGGRPPIWRVNNLLGNYI